jgi:hypothetical protein
VMPSGRFAVTRDNAKSIRSMRVMFITHQSSDDKRGNERRHDFASHNGLLRFP